MRHHLVIILAILALVVTACAEDDGASPTGAPDGTLDLFQSPAATAETEEPSPTETPEETEEPSPTETASPDATFGTDATGSPDASPTGSPDDDDGGTVGGVGTADCEEAFQDVPDLSRIDSLRQLQDALDALDETIEACESVDEWTDQAQDVLSLANLDIDAESFLEERCDESETLSDTELCESL